MIYNNCIKKKFKIKFKNLAKFKMVFYQLMNCLFAHKQISFLKITLVSYYTRIKNTPLKMKNSKIY